jgi:hypothetical protein
LSGTGMRGMLAGPGRCRCGVPPGNSPTAQTPRRRHPNCPRRRRSPPLRLAAWAHVPADRSEYPSV